MGAHVKSVVATMRVVDGDALLSPAVLERIVDAVLEALERHKAGEQSRSQDTKMGGACCDACDKEGLQ